MLISDLVSQVRRRGERCVIYDKMGSYTRAFFDPARDVLLNPLDARSPRWSPFYEARGPRDFDTTASALIPQQRDSADPFWVTAARQLFANGAAVLAQKGVTENKVLVDHLLKADLTALAQAMEGTVAQSIVEPDNPADGALGARDADRERERVGVPARHRHAVLDPGVGVGGRPRRVPVPHVQRRPARQPARAHIHLARNRGERDALARPGRRQKDLGDPRRAPDAPPGAVIAAGPGGKQAVRGLFRPRRAGRLGAPRPLRAPRVGDDLRPLRHPRGACRTRPGHRAVVGRQPRAQRGRGGSPRTSATAPTRSGMA